MTEPKVGNVSKSAFIDSGDKTFKELTFDMFDEINTTQKDLVKRKNRDTAISATSGLIGGMLAFLTLVIGKIKFNW